MKRYLGIVAFTVLVSLVYTGLAQLLPQLESHPPARLDRLPSDVGPEALAEMGQSVFDSVCAACHKIGQPGGRGPDLAGVGARARERARERSTATGQAYTDADYLLESLCKPGDYVVATFADIMPAQGRQLDGGQILAIAAFLQNLGAEATLSGNDIEPLRRFGCPTTVGGAATAVASAAPPYGAPPSIFSEACSACHSIDDATARLGPSLYDVGTRRTQGEIYESILAPDAVTASGFPASVMKATLDGNGFYERMTPADYRALADWLAQHRGAAGAAAPAAAAGDGGTPAAPQGVGNGGAAEDGGAAAPAGGP